jgi:cytokinin riboside 5'-monophosphate phosphoribohydrolase
LQVGLLNVDGYYNLLLAFIDKAKDDDFIKPSQLHILISVPDARDLVQKLEVIILSSVCLTNLLYEQI